MIGKRIGIQPTARFVLEMILAKHGIEPSQLDIVSIGFDMGPLITGQLDVVTGWQTNTKALSIIGPERIDFLPRQAGIDSYANVYFASAREFERNKATLNSYLAAVARGWGWAYHNRDEAIDILVDAYPNLDRKVEKATIDLVMNLSFTEQTAKDGWGTFNRSKLQTQIDQYSQHGLFRRAAPVYEALATQEILEATKHVRLKA
jgi:NitT/TauT family transport system substrate-binding protein